MIPIHNQQHLPNDSNYTFTELTTVNYPPIYTDCYGNSRFVLPVSNGFNEWDMVVKEERFQIRQKASYGSREIPIHFAFQNENEYQNVVETQDTQFNGLHCNSQKWTVIYQNKEEEVVTEPLLPKPSPNSPLTPQQAIEMLSKPIPSNINPKKIAEELKEWMTNNSCSQGFFSSNILNVCRSRFNYLINSSEVYDSLKSGKEHFVRMYNWLEMTKEERQEIMKMDLFGKAEKSVQVAENQEILLEKYEPPKRFSRKRPSSLQSESSTSSESTVSSLCPSPRRRLCHPTITQEMLTSFLNQPVESMDTKQISIEIKEWLEDTHATQEWFAPTILGRSRRTLSQAINNPRKWKDYGHQGQEMFMRIYNWMCLTEEQRQAIMRSHKPKSDKSQKSDDHVLEILRELRGKFDKFSK